MNDLTQIFSLKIRLLKTTYKNNYKNICKLFHFVVYLQCEIKTKEMTNSVKKFREENRGKWVWYNEAMGIDTALASGYIENTREQAIEAMAWHDNVTTEEIENNYENWYYILPVEEILDEYLIDFLGDER